MSRQSEAGKGSKQRKEAERGNHERGYVAIDWSVTRTEKQKDQEFIEQQRADNLARANEA